jgi:F0F1-type ATP synthase delta subunit
MRAHRGELFCEVTVAEPLDAAATKQLQEALQGFAKSGQKLNITTKVPFIYIFDSNIVYF